MKVLFAVSNEGISDSIIKKYQQEYKEIISSKNVYYFNAITKELQRDKSYDRIVISEDLEPFANNNYEVIDKFIFEKLDNISDEATSINGQDIPIILICADRRGKSESLLVKIFGIGIYSALLGQDRTVTKVCELINKPRSKKDAKIYYRIETDEVGYKSEAEGNVSEIEIQNILNHYKRLGKNEDQYVSSFDNIATQYTDEQLRVICKFLPIGVKAVLESYSQKYQELITFGTVTPSTSAKNNKVEQDKHMSNSNYQKRKLKQGKAQSGKQIKNLDIIEKNIGKTNLTKPVIIPSGGIASNNTLDTQEEQQLANQDILQTQMQSQETTQKKIVTSELSDRNQEDKTITSTIGYPKNEQQASMPTLTDVDEENNQIEENKNVVQKQPVEPPKRKRGRPRKVQLQENAVAQTNDQDVIINAIKPEVKESINIQQTETIESPKRKRGRPRKVKPQEETNVVLPGFEEEKDDIITDNLFNLGSKDNTNTENKGNISSQESLGGIILPGFEDEEEDQPNDMIQSFTSYSNTQNQNDDDNINSMPQGNTNTEYINPNYEAKEVESTKSTNQYQSANLESVLTRDKKIVAFVGTSKNGTSFLVNNLAEVISKKGINTAILDLTKNKNAYYIYTQNDEELRKKAFSCIQDLKVDIASGIQVNKNLTVYTTLPGENNDTESYREILTTLAQNYELVLMDCDFNTNYGYFKNAQEIYLVQSFDILTIQPLTAFLRDLKSKNVLNPEKLRIVLNKSLRVRNITERMIVGGMAYYNDPAMSFMTELFNKDTINYCTIPFEEQTYSKYLEGLVNCQISTNGYSKNFLSSLEKLANMVYPLLTNNKSSKKNYNSYDKSNANGFSNNMNKTLNKMKSSY